MLLTQTIARKEGVVRYECEDPVALPAECAAAFGAAVVPASAMHTSERVVSFRVPAAAELALDEDYTFTLTNCGLNAETTVHVAASGRAAGE